VYKKKLDTILEELLTIKSNLTEKMGKLDSKTNDLTSKLACIPDYYLDETSLFNTIVNKNYINRISNNLDKSTSTSSKKSLPKCVDLEFNMGCFEHLPGMQNRTKLKMDPEDTLNGFELYIAAFKQPQILTEGLKKNPNSWKYHTLSSYYWRYKGNAKEAIKCARNAVALAPRKYKDIALLSLSTILQRSNFLNDSLIVVSAAVDHDPSEPENHLAMGNNYILLSEFNKSFESYKIAESLNTLYSSKIEYIKQSILCFRDLKINLLAMEG
jgi:tetratricopeptide (TPR) repeat protein